MFGDQHAWFVPYYVDLGTGQSEFTWQGITGLGYAFHWGEVIGVWRYLDYRFSSHSSSLTLNGPAIGVAFRWQCRAQRVWQLLPRAHRAYSAGNGASPPHVGDPFMIGIED
ncbi:MAG TPA: hypothetical protein VH109_03720 [Steroidobacteraceae bacterium]|jgi:hypothetical protein|nr:hypothetical protein [Steroidobacteraceae bacterium]